MVVLSLGLAQIAAARPWQFSYLPPLVYGRVTHALRVQYIVHEQFQLLPEALTNVQNDDV